MNGRSLVAILLVGFKVVVRSQKYLPHIFLKIAQNGPLKKSHFYFYQIKCCSNKSEKNPVMFNHNDTCLADSNIYLFIDKLIRNYWLLDDIFYLII